MSLAEVKPLVSSENRYVIAAKTDKELESSVKLKRTTKSLLNKFTPEKFEKLCEQFLDLEINSREDMVDVIDLIFDKALFEPIFGGMYASLCTRCMEKFPEFPDERNPGGKPHTFKRLLLNKCQEEFEKENSVQEEVDRDVVEAEAAGEKRSPEEAAANEASIRKKAKARMLGNIRFIGELYKQRMLTEKIMHECLIKLLGDIENPEEDYIECLCKLMTTIGKDIDQAKAKLHMDEYFTRMSEMSKNPNLVNRLRFMLQEVITLRKGGWRKREAGEGPPQGQRGGGARIEKGSGDVRKEAAARQQQRPAQPPQGRGPPARGGAGGGTEWNVAGGARGGAGAASTSAAAAAKPAAPPPPKELTADQLQEKLEQDFEEYLSCGDVSELCLCLDKLQPVAPKSDRTLGAQLVGLAIGKVLDSRTDEPRLKVAKLVGELGKNKKLTSADVKQCFDELLEFIDDEVIDVPQISKYMATFIAHAIADGLLKLDYVNVAFAHLRECEGVSALSMLMGVLKALVGLQSEETVRVAYEQARVKVQAALPAADATAVGAAAALEANGLACLDPALVKGVNEERERGEREERETQRQAQMQRLDAYLRDALSKTASQGDKDILSWMQSQQLPQTNDVARLVVRRVLESAGYQPGGEGAASQSAALLKVLSQRDTLLKAMLHPGSEGGNRQELQRQAACLFEVQAFCNSLSFPTGLLKKIFYHLYNDDVVFEEAYSVWREDLGDTTPGKMEALVHAREFLEWLETAEEDEEGEGKD